MKLKSYRSRPTTAAVASPRSLLPLQLFTILSDQASRRRNCSGSRSSQVLEALACLNRGFNRMEQVGMEDVGDDDEPWVR